MSNIHMMTLGCSNNECMGRLRIGRFLDKPYLQVGALKFCPICGSHASAHTDTDESYWETLAESYNMPVEMFQQLFNCWREDLKSGATRCNKLIDYAKELQAEIAKETVSV